MNPNKYSNKRDTLHVIADILSVIAQQRRRKTAIMFRANLTLDMTDRYLALLLKTGLVEHNPIDRTYNITTKGLRFTSEINKAIAVLNGEDIDYVD